MKRVLLCALICACGGSGDSIGDEDEPGVDASAGPTTEHGGPRILSLSTNVGVLSEQQELVVAAVVTDPDGINDLIGGVLIDPDTAASYGAFTTSAAEGSYQLTLRWSAIHAVRSVDGPAEGVVHTLRARFFDEAGHVAEQDVSARLQCDQGEWPGRWSCGGECRSAAYCGGCAATCGAETECDAESDLCLGWSTDKASCDWFCAESGLRCEQAVEYYIGSRFDIPCSSGGGQYSKIYCACVP